MSSKLENVRIFSLSANKVLAKEVATALGITVSPNVVTHFADGEVFCKAHCDVTDSLCYVIQSTCKPVDEHLMEIFTFIDALKNAGAKEVNLVVPYFGYSRQDRIIQVGDPVTTKMVANLFQAAGADRIISVDLHSERMLTFFNVPIVNLYPTKVFADFYQEEINKLGYKNEETVIVAPDKGSVRRADAISKYLVGSEVAYLSKFRPAPNQCVINDVNGNVDRKLCIIIDDIIDTGGTICAATKILFEKGASDVAVIASHGVFSNNAVDKLCATGIKTVACSNSIEQTDERVDVVSLAETIANFIKEDIA